jgi:hypothetical protein
MLYTLATSVGMPDLDDSEKVRLQAATAVVRNGSQIDLTDRVAGRSLSGLSAYVRILAAITPARKLSTVIDGVPNQPPCGSKLDGGPPRTSDGPTP